MNSLIDDNSTVDVSFKKRTMQYPSSSRKNNAPRNTTTLEDPNPSFLQEVSNFWYNAFANIDAESIGNSEASWCSSRNLGSDSICCSGEGVDGSENDDQRNPKILSRRKARECHGNDLRIEVERENLQKTTRISSSNNDAKLNRNLNEEKQSKTCSSTAVVADDRIVNRLQHHLRGDRVVNRFRQYIGSMQDEIKQMKLKEKQQEITNKKNTLSSHHDDANNDCNSTIQSNDCSTIFTFDDCNENYHNHSHWTPNSPRFVVDSRLADLKSLPRIVEGEEEDAKFLANTFGDSYGGDDWSVGRAPPPSMTKSPLNPHTTKASAALPSSVDISLNSIAPPSLANASVKSSINKTLFAPNTMVNASINNPPTIKAASIVTPPSMTTLPLNSYAARIASIVLPPSVTNASLNPLAPPIVANASIKSSTNKTLFAPPNMTNASMNQRIYSQNID